MGVNLEFNFVHAPEDAPNFCGDSGFRTKNTDLSTVPGSYLNRHIVFEG